MKNGKIPSFQVRVPAILSTYCTVLALLVTPPVTCFLEVVMSSECYFVSLLDAKSMCGVCRCHCKSLLAIMTWNLRCAFLLNLKECEFFYSGLCLFMSHNKHLERSRGFANLTCVRSLMLHHPHTLCRMHAWWGSFPYWT